MLTNKKVRAIIGRLKEACAYEEDILLYQGDLSFLIKIDQVLVNDFRELADEFQIRVITDCNLSNISAPTYLLITINDSNYKLKLSISPGSTQENLYSIKRQEIIQFERRKGDRKILNNSPWIPAFIYLTPSDFSFEAQCKVLNFDEEHVSFFIDGPLGSLQRLKGQTGKVFFANGTLPFKQKEFDLTSSRVESGNNTNENHIIVCKLSEYLKPFSAKRSKVQQPFPITFSFRFHFEVAKNVRLKVNSFLKDGLVCECLGVDFTQLPLSFGAELEEVDILFTVYKVANSLYLRLMHDSAGERIKWYNYLSKEVLGKFTSFSDVNVKSITRLIIDANLQDSSRIQERINLHPFIDQKWSMEKDFAKTKLRWLVKDKSGNLLGHLSALRISNSIWSAIDNIGSQSYEGSWNKNHVKDWLLIFKEALESSSTPSLIQWSHIKSAKVWANFEQNLLNNRELYETNSAMQVGHFKKDTPSHRKMSISIRDIEHPQSIGEKLTEDNSAFCSSLFSGLNNSNSEFQMDFRDDYHQSLKRFSKIVQVDGKNSLFATYSNYPFWTSINNGHNFCYFFPFKDFTNDLTEGLLANLLEEVKIQMYIDGCLPFSYAFVTSKKIPNCFEMENFLLKAEALDLVVAQLEGKL